MKKIVKYVKEITGYEYPEIDTSSGEGYVTFYYPKAEIVVYLDEGEPVALSGEVEADSQPDWKGVIFQKGTPDWDDDETVFAFHYGF